MAEIVWTDLAIEDLKNIYDYISQNSPFYANLQISKLIDRTEKLKYFPKLGRIVPEFGLKHIREVIVGHYRIVYQIESEDKIGIARIHHSSQLIT